MSSRPRAAGPSGGIWGRGGLASTGNGNDNGLGLGTLVAAPPRCVGPGRLVAVTRCFLPKCSQRFRQWEMDFFVVQRALLNVGLKTLA